MKLLVVEKDDLIISALSTAGRRNEFVLFHAGTLADALLQLHQQPDVILLDLELPDSDGFYVCERLRRVTAMPLIVTTARTDYGVRVRCLNLGADDCLARPYNVVELVARIVAVTRRSALTWATLRQGAATLPAPAPALSAACGSGQVDLGRVHIDLPSRSVTVDRQQITLTRKEFDLLAILARRPGLVLRHEEIITEVWHTSWPETRRTLHVYVASLRSKLKSPGIIESIHGVGYRLAMQ